MTMLYPSIDLLMQKVDSKYKLVTVVAKRARELQDGAELTVKKPVSKKFVGQALEEIASDKVELVEEK
ncbi:DNA-directed RNA polymerase subunit omega [Geobacillus subterraneus]|uniref:DNA-directed RNA polymerase subunit omega n=2 Tax=Geobacillus TaxID=129337 RepID=A0A679FYE4_9BACL|nr:DNA-directed RNA polymerase subunit omega [Geobacillus subterraneus]